MSQRRIDAIYPKLTNAILKAVADEMRPKLIGATLRSVKTETNPDDAVDDILLRFKSHSDDFWLRFSFHPVFCRLVALESKPATEDTTEELGFVRQLSIVKDGRVSDATVAPFDRIVEFTLNKHGESFHLIAELFGPASNMYLLDAGKRILAIMREIHGKKRILRPGADYLPPDALEPDQGLTRLAPLISDDDSHRHPKFPISGWYESLAKHHQRARMVKLLRESLERDLERRRALAERRLDSLNATISQEFRAAEWQQEGTIILSNRASISRGADTVRLDTFDDPPKKIDVSLDPRKSPQKNAEIKFKNAAKLKGRVEHAQNEIPLMANRIELLNGIETELKKTLARDVAVHPDGVDVSPDDLLIMKLQNLRRELDRIAPDGKNRNLQMQITKKRPRAAAGTCPWTGSEILVGKSAADNDRLTFRIAEGNDYWFHAAGGAGAHVVARTGGREIPQQTLLDAATLAIHYSGTAKRSSGEVYVSRRKNVTKSKGMPPGKVNVGGGKLLTIRIEAERLARLKQPKNEG